MYPKVSILSGKRAIQSGGTSSGTSELMETNSFRDPCALYGGIYPTAVPPGVLSNRESRFDVILSVSEESRISSSYEAEILRLLPQDDTGTQSRRGG